MNIVFLGSADFAVPSLKLLLTTDHKISCVVTQPDRQKGRGLSVAGTAVKTVALEEDLQIYQPEDINAAGTITLLKKLNPELFVVIAYGQILSEELLDIPEIFAINLHASILPRYRGAAPINWAIINGESTTGVTVIKMTRQMDAGPIILQKEIGISTDDTSVTLEERLSGIGAHLLLQAIKLIETGKYDLVPQDEEGVVFAPKLKKEDGLIKWDKPAQDIYNLIRGYIPWPGAFTYYQGKLLKIYKARVSSRVLEFASSNPGEILEASKEGIAVFTGKGNIIIEELQIEGKRRMAAGDFIAGYKILPREILGTKK
jgi:methionyl-tRNA formyltransferase